MEKATISEIKNHLSAYLKKVRTGVSVLILDRNQPVARLERIEANEYPDERLTRLELQGVVRRSTKPVPLDLLRSPAPKPKDSVLQALLEERQEGR
jgi:prevent-host-death family protein